MTWELSQIWIYPVKSLPGVSVTATEILPAGNLRHDREFALVDTDGRFVNAKREPLIHRIHVNWDWPSRCVTLSASEFGPCRFCIFEDQRQLADWFSHFFQRPIQIEQQVHGGFPDDTEASGPTVISTETLQTVSQWFGGLKLDEVRRRFRSNLELVGAGAFSEDRLFGTSGKFVDFRIGDARLYGTNPCQRCVVPTRDSETGEITPEFQKTFSRLRDSTLPKWVERSRFNHFYRLSVNTRTRSEGPQMVHIGDEVAIEAENQAK